MINISVCLESECYGVSLVCIINIYLQNEVFYQLSSAQYKLCLVSHKIAVRVNVRTLFINSNKRMPFHA